MSKNDSGTLNNTYLNNFDIFNKVLKKQFKNKELQNQRFDQCRVRTILQSKSNLHQLVQRNETDK